MQKIASEWDNSMKSMANFPHRVCTSRVREENLLSLCCCESGCYENGTYLHVHELSTTLDCLTRVLQGGTSPTGTDTPVHAHLYPMKRSPLFGSTNGTLMEPIVG